MGEFAKSPRGHKFLDENIGHMVRGMAMAEFIPKGAPETPPEVPAASKP